MPYARAQRKGSRVYRFIPVLFFVFLLAACGGGGDAKSETPTNPPSNAAATNTPTQDVAGAKTNTPATTATVATQPGTYTVAAGDTLGEIATQFGTTVEALVAANSLADANTIYVGQVLKVGPAATGTPASGQ